MDRILTIPNLLSLSRLILVWPIVFSLQNHHLLLFSVLGAIAVLTDFLDGYLSRLLNQRSRFGQVIDPIVDGILVLSILITLALQNIIPTWFPGLIMGRYTIAVLFLSYYRIKTQLTPQSIQSGKWSMCSIAVFIAIALLIPSYTLLYHLALLTSSVLLISSLVEYIHVYRYTKN